MKKFFPGLMAGFMALCLTGMTLSCSNSADNDSSFSETKPTTYTVIFNANDGSTKPATESQTFIEGEAQTLKTIAELGFTRNGYSFAGWGMKGDATQTSFSDGASYTATKDLTLYALWTQIPMYQVEIVVNGRGSCNATPDTASEGTEITLNHVPENGYELSSLSVIDENSNVINVENGKFIMPASNVRVDILFEFTGIYYTDLANLDDVISQLSGNNTSTITIIGELKDTDLSLIKTAINKSKTGINLDLSKVTGLSKIPDSGGFNMCTKLIGVSLPDSLQEIGNYTFQGTSLKSVTIPKGVTTIGINAFSSCFYLKHVDIPSTVATIRNGAFSSCNILESIEIPYGITTIEENTFRLCWGLQSIKIPSSVTIIEDNSFTDCKSLKSIEISNSVTTLGDGVFTGCFKLESVEIPESVRFIGNTIFANCSCLSNIKFKDANGWYCTNKKNDWENMTNGTQMPDLSDASKNAEYFVDGDYTSYYLYKLSNNN